MQTPLTAAGSTSPSAAASRRARSSRRGKSRLSVSAWDTAVEVSTLSTTCHQPAGTKSTYRHMVHCMVHCMVHYIEHNIHEEHLFAGAASSMRVGRDSLPTSRAGQGPLFSPIQLTTKSTRRVDAHLARPLHDHARAGGQRGGAAEPLERREIETAVQPEEQRLGHRHGMAGRLCPTSVQHRTGMAGQLC